MAGRQCYLWEEEADDWPDSITADPSSGLRRVKYAARLTLPLHPRIVKVGGGEHGFESEADLKVGFGITISEIETVVLEAVK